MAKLLGAIFATYFMIYPIIYFGYNYMAETLGYGQYTIPGFWFGMLGYLLLNIVKNSVFPKNKLDTVS